MDALMQLIQIHTYTYISSSLIGHLTKFYYSTISSLDTDNRYYHSTMIENLIKYI